MNLPTLLEFRCRGRVTQVARKVHLQRNPPRTRCPISRGRIRRTGAAALHSFRAVCTCCNVCKAQGTYVYVGFVTRAARSAAPPASPRAPPARGGA